MKDAPAKVQMYVGESHDGKGYPEAEFNPYEQAVIFRDHHGNAIRLKPESMRQALREVTAFVELLERIGVKTR